MEERSAVPRGRLLIALVGSIGFLALDSPSTGHATSYQPVALDMSLLQSDAIVFGTVNEVTPLPTDGLIRLSLTDIRFVGGRWDVDPAGLEFNVSARLRPSGGVRPRRHEVELLPGHRYLLLFEGGAWRDAPLLHGSLAMLEVADDVTRCAGGEIYGLEPFGLMCSTADQQAAPPLTEIELANLLTRRMAIARERRPAEAAELDRAARTLEDTPEAP
ncbi:MAG: hypothetical protein IT379_07670 [Deltaproteobacteria bacterium]|nr:hypothetical protein [Deltaproteobacteria bacterium]